MTMLMMMTMMITLMMMKKKKNKNKNTYIECGFEKMSKEKSSFSMNTFMITIMFIILDLEFVIMMPFNNSENKMNIKTNSFMMIIMMIMMTMMMEQKKNMIKWSI